MPQAERSLETYVRLLSLHMRHEEELLLPVYCREQPPQRFPLVLFTGQHQRMRELLANVRQRLAGLASNARTTTREIIELMDYERTYKHLVEHHDGAERAALFPTLDRLLSADEQRRLIEPCAAEWLALERELTIGSQE